MSFFLNQLSITSCFADAVAFSNKILAQQSVVSAEVEDAELAQLRSHLELSGFTVRQTLNDVSDLAFHLERSQKRLCGLIVIRKRAISIDLLKSVHAFLECRSDSQVVIVNGCNPLGDAPSEDVSDFWICMAQRSGFFYAEDDDPVRLFQQDRLSTSANE
jgi:hypothetical protein